MSQSGRPPRIAATAASDVELVFPLGSAVRVAARVEREVRLQPGDMLHLELTRDQADMVTRDGAVWLGYRLTDGTVLTSGSGGAK